MRPGPVAFNRTERGSNASRGRWRTRVRSARCREAHRMSTTSTATIHAAIYARVSSDQQAQEQTIESQVAALRERVASDGLALEEELCFLDDGVSGSTLMRPALERLRDVAYAGAIQKLYVHSPDRLPPRYAAHAALVGGLHKDS